MAATEGTELFGLPPRKRFKVMEQQRRREEEEEESSPRVHRPCNDVTNTMPLHRVSPKKLTSQGFLVLEKRKYKLLQQELQENLVPAMLPLPPRPVAVKREAPAALPLQSAPPTVRLKFQGEKVHSLSPSAFKSWGSASPPKPGFVAPEAASSELPGSKKKSPSEARKGSGHRLKRHVRAWTMAEGTCSINKAPEDVEMMVCEVPEIHVNLGSHAASSAGMVGVDLVSESGNRSQVDASDDHMVCAAQVIEVDTMMTEFPSAPVEDQVMHEVHDVEEEGGESKGATEIITAADLGRFVPLDVADDSHCSSPGNTTIVEEAANIVGPTLGNPVVDRTELSGAVESEAGDGGKTVRNAEEATDRLHATNATLGVPEACFSQFTDPLTITGSPIVESHTSAETSNVSKTSEDFTSVTTNKDMVGLLNPCDKAGGETCSAGKHEEPATQVVIDAAHVCLDEVKVVEYKERVAATTLGDSLGEPDTTHQDRLLAEIDERADHLFKRMLEREGYERCKLEQGSADDSVSQFFLASSDVNDIDSMEVEGGPALTSQDLEETPTTPIDDGRADDVISSEDFQIDLGRSTVVERQYNMPPEEMTGEMPGSSSGDFQVHEEDSVCSEDEEIECPIPSGSRRLKEQLQEADCKSSKEDGDWDLEMEIPNFTFGKRSGMTQRVKAPGVWLQSSGVDSTNLDEEEAGADEDEDEDEDDGACDICRNPDAEPSNPIVYCDGCDVPVHVDCYGNPLCHGVPEGDWFCAQCQHRSPNSRSCCLCPRSGGAMKMTTDGNWAHLSCAVFVPEVFFRKADDLEGIDTSHVPSKRWLSTCCVCKSTGGACVDCTEIGCKSSFHVSCALKKDLAMEFRNGRSGAIVISFCQEHTATWDEQQEARKAGRSKYKIVSREPQKIKAVSQRSKLR